MKALEAIRRRYSFELPDSFRALQALGHLEVSGSPSGRPRSTENYLAFYDCEWLPLEGIANYRFTPWTIAADGGFVPFAITGRDEPYCWRLDWSSGGEPAIVLVERCEDGVCLAPDFRAFLYRLALEAFAGRNDFLGDAKVDELNRAVEIVAPLLPPHWTRRLMDLRDRHWEHDKKRGNLLVLPWEECTAIIQQELSFSHLNERFIHDKEYLKRSK
jgi:hypothetical protein